jgi:hypothetical protein
MLATEAGQVPFDHFSEEQAPMPKDYFYMIRQVIDLFLLKL